MTTADVEYTVKLQFVVLKKQTDVWILLCFNFLEILSYIFFFFLASSISFAPESSYAAG